MIFFFSVDYKLCLLACYPSAKFTHLQKKKQIRLGGPRKELCWLIKRLQRPNPFQNGKLAWHLINTEKINRNRPRKKDQKGQQNENTSNNSIKNMPGRMIYNISGSVRRHKIKRGNYNGRTWTLAWSPFCSFFRGIFKK